ncbi:class I SAM-dependent methyltransferase [Yinghuangia sp. ASG 101]|uniref:class I SAM-dependent methyltransferase n=1 Tax=Yinghuangia sp. ASG 101 TaxID=2896848 RepID=UPI001E354532|nr:class I SAM-dependent methyltransferase [Yinghuangia sp. ASG 101]UGQ12380.1 class I SAM-dependent methyltransferase [Yinghuangia sp. ASG 101]
MTDLYTSTAEFYDLVAARQVAGSGPALRAVLADADPAAGPVVEVGAGTGRVTEVIAAAVPDADIIAVEPSAAMRAVLGWRIGRDAALRRRVTIVAGAAPDLPLPERLSAAVVFGVAGHLLPAERVRMWRRLTERMPSGAPVAVELMGTAAPRPMPATLSLRERIGRQDYEWWIAAEPAGPAVTRFTTTWKVLRDGRVLREVTDGYDWHVHDADTLARESGRPVRQFRRVGGHHVPRLGVVYA